MRLADFLEQHAGRIVDDAEKFAATLLPAARHLDSEALRDHLPVILEVIARDLRTVQTQEEAQHNSHGKAKPPTASPSAAETHALLRAKGGFNIEQMVGEYRALRSSVLRLWSASGDPLDPDALTDIVRFNEAIDQAVSESVVFFSTEVERWRHIFLGVLGHDLRGPLNAILLTSEVLGRAALNAPVADFTSRITRSGKRMQSLLDELLDFSRSSLGLGITIQRAPVDLAQACQEELDLLRGTLPGRRITLQLQGMTHGNYDASRIREALANLVTNAAKYGTTDGSIDITLTGDDGTVRLAVQNTGEPIPAETIHALFEPLRRGAIGPPDKADERASLGLGLFVVREIAKAHGGAVDVTSGDGKVVFSMSMPGDAG